MSKQYTGEKKLTTRIYRDRTRTIKRRGNGLTEKTKKERKKERKNGHSREITHNASFKVYSKSCYTRDIASRRLNLALMRAKKSTLRMCDEKLKLLGIGQSKKLENSVEKPLGALKILNDDNSDDRRSLNSWKTILPRKRTWLITLASVSSNNRARPSFCLRHEGEEGSISKYNVPARAPRFAPVLSLDNIDFFPPLCARSYLASSSRLSAYPP